MVVKEPQSGVFVWILGDFLRVRESKWLIAISCVLLVISAADQEVSEEIRPKLLFYHFRTE